MKATLCVSAVLAVGLLAGSGCRKAEDQPGPTPVYYGVKVDLPKLDTEFTTASQEVQASAALVKQYLRYAQVRQALAELSKLAQDSTLTETQKKVVNDLTEQTKQVITNSSPSPGQ
ncbi:MAG TPA: hypothetical protein VJA21_16430 [Verrucomicrobiae bacterium]